MATMEEQFKEDWDAERGICFERRDFYLIKHCACSVPVCVECYFSIQNTQGGYSCPGCRNVPPPIRELTEAQTVVARWNWTRSFDEQMGAQVILNKLPLFRVQDRRAVWELLHTGPFTLNRGAGVCLDREASRVFVACQLHRFSQTKFWTLGDSGRNSGSDSSFDYDEAEMEDVNR